MYQIVCRLGLRPIPRGRMGLTALPRPPSWILGGLLLREGEGTRGERREGRAGKRRGRKGKGKEGEAREGAGSAPQVKTWPPLLFSWRRRWVSVSLTLAAAPFRPIVHSIAYPDPPAEKT